jgi:hypothetical protein
MSKSDKLAAKKRDINVWLIASVSFVIVILGILTIK